MQVRFPTVDKNYIKTMVQHGYYTTENELVRDAVRRMREKNKQHQFLAAIQVGDKQIENGEITSYSDNLLKKLAKNATKRASNNEKPNPDVTP